MIVIFRFLVHFFVIFDQAFIVFLRVCDHVSECPFYGSVRFVFVFYGMLFWPIDHFAGSFPFRLNCFVCHFILCALLFNKDDDDHDDDDDDKTKRFNLFGWWSRDMCALATPAALPLILLCDFKVFGRVRSWLPENITIFDVWPCAFEFSCERVCVEVQS